MQRCGWHLLSPKNTMHTNISTKSYAQHSTELRPTLAFPKNTRSTKISTKSYWYGFLAGSTLGHHVLVEGMLFYCMFFGVENKTLQKSGTRANQFLHEVLDDGHIFPCCWCIALWASLGLTAALMVRPCKRFPTNVQWENPAPVNHRNSFESPCVRHVSALSCPSCARSFSAQVHFVCSWPAMGHQQFNDDLREGEVLGGGFHFSFWNF